MLEKQRRQKGKNEKGKKKPREKQFTQKKKVKYFFFLTWAKQIHFNSLKLQRVDLRWHLTTTSATKINGWEKIQTVTNMKGVN